MTDNGLFASVLVFGIAIIGSTIIVVSVWWNITEYLCR